MTQDAKALLERLKEYDGYSFLAYLEDVNLQELIRSGEVKVEIDYDGKYARCRRIAV